MGRTFWLGFDLEGRERQQRLSSWAVPSSLVLFFNFFIVFYCILFVGSIVNFTLPNGTQRNGQVLEVAGTKAIVQVSGVNKMLVVE